MPHLRKYFAVFLLALWMTASPSLFFSQVFHHPRPSDKLIERWDWALQEARKLGLKDGLWIGYSIKRLMGEYSYIYSTSKYTMSGHYPFPSYLRGKALGEIIYGKDFDVVLSAEEQVHIAAKRTLEELRKKRKDKSKVLKDVAVLFRYRSSSKKIPEALRLSNLSLPFDSKGFPVFWLDHAEDGESITLLGSIYKSKIPEKLKKKTLSTIGFHQKSEIVVPFLEKVLKSKESDALRGRAASELEDHSTEQALKLLRQAAKNDRSFYVRKNAVYALEDMEHPGSTDALIDIARNSDDMEIRKKALYGLAEKASKKAEEALEDIAYEDEDTEVQKRAVYALEDLPDGRGIPYLIKIAKAHPKLVIRKKAIYCLGDSGDQRALKALIDILQKK